METEGKEIFFFVFWNLKSLFLSLQNLLTWTEPKFEVLEVRSHAFLMSSVNRWAWDWDWDEVKGGEKVHLQLFGWHSACMFSCSSLLMKEIVHLNLTSLSSSVTVKWSFHVSQATTGFFLNKKLAYSEHWFWMWALCLSLWKLLCSPAVLTLKYLPGELGDEYGR